MPNKNKMIKKIREAGKKLETISLQKHNDSDLHVRASNICRIDGELQEVIFYLNNLYDEVQRNFDNINKTR